MTTYEMEELLKIGFQIMKEKMKEEGVTLVAKSMSDANRAEIQIIAYQDEEEA